MTARRWVLDTNIYIDAIRNETARAQLANWQRCMAPFIHQHAVVVAEILVGARDPLTWRRWHERWIAPAERLGRIVTPTYNTWLRASRIIAALAAEYQHPPRSFFNDCLLAASAREVGFEIVTWNVADFERIARVEPGLEYAVPFP